MSECKEESTLAGGTSKGRTRELIRKNYCQGDGSPPAGGGGGGGGQDCNCKWGRISKGGGCMPWIENTQKTERNEMDVA